MSFRNHYPKQSVVGKNVGSGKYLTPTAGFGVDTAYPVTANLEHAYRFDTGANTRYDRIGLEVTTPGAAGTVIRLGIRADDGSLFPSTLIVDAGTIDGTLAAFQEIAINVDLAPYRTYWLTASSQVAGAGLLVRGLVGRDPALGVASPGNQVSGFFQSGPGAFAASWSGPRTSLINTFMKICARVA